LHDNVLHKWIQKYDHDVGYYVNCIYSILNQNDEMGNNFHNDLTHHEVVLLGSLFHSRGYGNE